MIYHLFIFPFYATLTAAMELAKTAVNLSRIR